MYKNGTKNSREGGEKTYPVSMKEKVNEKEYRMRRDKHIRKM